MLESMSSMELTMWQAFLIEDHKRHEAAAERAAKDREYM